MKILFLKPSIAKVIVSIILFVFFVPFLKLHEINCFTAPCPQPGTIPLSLVPLAPSSVVGIHYLSLFIGIIISYVASILLIAIVKKIRHR